MWKSLSENKEQPAERGELGTAPISRLLTKLAVPLAASLLVQVLYGLVDNIYVSYLGENALTAISFATPLQGIVAGIGAGMAVGVNALVSRKLGQNDGKGVTKTAGNAFLIVWSLSVLFLILGFTVLRPFLAAQIEDSSILDLSLTYSRIIYMFSFASLHQLLFERLLSSTGKTRLTMVSMIGGAVINIILDPIMIFGLLGFPALGMAGAAYATVLAQACAACIGLMLNLKRNKEIHFRVRGFMPEPAVLKEIIAIGVPTSINMCVFSVLSLSMNHILIGLSALAPAIYIVYVRLQAFFIVPTNGINNADITVISYNYGMKSKGRILETLKKSILANLMITLIGTLVFLTLPSLLLGLFNASDGMLALGIPALRILSFTFPLAGTSILLTGFMQALGKTKYSTAMALSQVVFQLSAAWLLSLTGNLTLTWLAFPIMEILRLILAVILAGRTYREQVSGLQENGGE